MFASLFRGNSEIVVRRGVSVGRGGGVGEAWRRKIRRDLREL